jgi:CRP-like cAMP-binding protein
VERFFTTICQGDEKTAKELFALFTHRKVAAGELLFDYHDVAHSFFILQDGRLAVHKYTGFLKKMQVIALLDPNSVIGEGALLVQHKRTSRVTAIADSHLLEISRENFSLFQAQSPEAGVLFLEYLLRIVGLRLEKTSERLARIL